MFVVFFKVLLTELEPNVIAYPCCFVRESGGMVGAGVRYDGEGLRYSDGERQHYECVTFVLGAYPPRLLEFKNESEL